MKKRIISAIFSMATVISTVTALTSMPMSGHGTQIQRNIKMSLKIMRSLMTTDFSVNMA